MRNERRFFLISPSRQDGSAASGSWPNAAGLPGSWGVAVFSVRPACTRRSPQHRQVRSPDLWTKEGKVIITMWVEWFGRVGCSLGNCKSFFRSLEREEKTLNLHDGTITRMDPARNGPLGSLSDAKRTTRKGERRLSDEAGVGNVKMSPLDLWRRRPRESRDQGVNDKFGLALWNRLVNTDIIHLVSLKRTYGTLLTG